MTDFPAAGAMSFSSEVNPGSDLSLGDYMALFGASMTSSATWPVANSAMFVPFMLNERALATQMSHQNGLAVMGNVDVGIYDERGNRLVSKGSTAQAGTSALQVHDIADTVLVPGLYYMAIAIDNIVGTLLRASANTQPLRVLGVRSMASAFPLPDPVTFAVPASGYIPSLAVHLTALV